MAGICTVAYGVYALVAFYRFGRYRSELGDDLLVDRFMPTYDVREEHHIRVNAAAATTIEAARSIDIDDSAFIRAIFTAREVFLRARPSPNSHAKAFVEWLESLGWRVLAELPGREMTFGAVTRPWEADVVFRGLSPSEFIAFNEAGYVKILFTLRAEPVDQSRCVFRTETRAVATDPESRGRFRRYWAMFSAGILLIRVLVLPMVRSAAERGKRCLEAEALSAR